MVCKCKDCSFYKYCRIADSVKATIKACKDYTTDMNNLKLAVRDFVGAFGV